MGGGWGFDKDTHGLYLRLGTIETETTWATLCPGPDPSMRSLVSSRLVKIAHFRNRHFRGVAHRSCLLGVMDADSD